MTRALGSLQSASQVIVQGPRTFAKRCGTLRLYKRGPTPQQRRDRGLSPGPHRRPRRHGRCPAAPSATMAGASRSRHRMPPSRIAMRLRTGYLDRQSRRSKRGVGAQRRMGAGPFGLFPRTRGADLVRNRARGVRPDLGRTNPAHYLVRGYLPSAGRWSKGGQQLGILMPVDARLGNLRGLCARCSKCTAAASRPSTTATTSAGREDECVADAFAFPSSCGVHSARSSAGQGPVFRWGRAVRAIPRTSTRPMRRCRALFPEAPICTAGSPGAQPHHSSFAARSLAGLGQRHIAASRSRVVESGRAEGALGIVRTISTPAPSRPNRETGD